MKYRLIESADIPDLFEIRVATWHNPNGREEMAKLGITPDAVAEMLASTHRGWICEVEGRKTGFCIGDKTTGEM